MEQQDLAQIHRNYIACLNRRDWDGLRDFVGNDVRHNSRALGLGGYRRMLERDCDAIPDLRFAVARLVADGTHVAARLRFDCTRRGEFLGLPVNGRRVTFHENIFYAFGYGRIVEAWSILDRTEIEAQLAATCISRNDEGPFPGWETAPRSSMPICDGAPAIRPPRRRPWPSRRSRRTTPDRHRRWRPAPCGR
ncbi:MAG: ester cyclase [Gluconacetobacter diazotrophicus]|nr:ester cyclase [Gluconacetobacter diazotrophicus]